ncbi:MAG: DivIVA domain, partial [Frankiales bacterium]|nr:DivIVA domain [Frankiales bacterium]
MSTELFRVPVEVLADAVVFDVVSRGYDRRQVDAHVAALEQELAELRWAQDDLAAQQEALAAQREAQERWTPSFDARGARVVEVLRLAEQEAAALREEAAGEVGRLRHEATAALLAERADLERGLGEARQAAARELRSLESAGESRR